MAQTKTRNEAIDGEGPRSCCGDQERKSACPCAANGGCPQEARWVCLAVVIGGLGILAFRTARRCAGHRPAAG